MTKNDTPATSTEATPKAKAAPEPVIRQKAPPGSTYAAHQARMIDQAKRIAGRVPGPTVDPATAPTDTPLAGGRLRCARRSCETSLDCTGMTLEQVMHFAEVHGFVKNGTDIYCSRRCKILNDVSPDGGGVAKPVAPKLAVGAPPTRVTIRDGAVHCDYASCGALFQTDGGTEEHALRIAAAQAWVQTPDGVFCGGTCAKRARADIAAGLHPVARTVDEAAAAVKGSTTAAVASTETDTKKRELAAAATPATCA